jgi:ectoine hydroxylase-related dioxygenase (phytanoyl-CoA dioxygenase family)
MDGAEFRETYWSQGYVVIRNLVSDQKIDSFLDKHKPEGLVLDESSPSYQSYIDRDEYTRSAELRNVLCGEEISKHFQHLNKHFALHLSEARIGTSGIKWHIDYLDQFIDYADNYIGVHVALSDVDIECGPFELIPGSHRWAKNPKILNQDNCRENHHACYDYNENLIKEMGVEPYVFEAKKGDVLFWHGHLYHRGAEIKNWRIGRDVLFGHYQAISELEAESCINGLPGRRIRNNNGIFYIVENYHD